MVETTLTNPGIIDRLEQDITDYLSSFGFSIERHEIDKTVSSDTNNKCNNKSKCNRAVLTSPSLPDDGPICTLHLHIYNVLDCVVLCIGRRLATHLTQLYMTQQTMSAVSHSKQCLLCNTAEIVCCRTQQMQTWDLGEMI